MTHSSYFFKFTEKFAHSIAHTAHTRLSLNQFGAVTTTVGILSPLWLWISNFSSNSLWVMLSFIFFSIYVILDASIYQLETIHRKKSLYTSLIPFPPLILFFLWFQFVFYEYQHIHWGMSALRYLNIFSLCCVISSVLLIYGYLKINNLPLNIHRFVEKLESIGNENERVAPFNYITITFKLVKKDLVAIGFTIVGIINNNILYVLIVSGTVINLGFTIYSLLLLNFMDRKKSNEEPDADQVKQDE